MDQDIVDLVENYAQALLDLVADARGDNDVPLNLDALRKQLEKRRRDQETDLEKRVLVGPRLPRWMVNRYRRAARRQGMSLYQWSTLALEEYLARSNAGPEPG